MVNMNVITQPFKDVSATLVTDFALEYTFTLGCIPREIYTAETWQSTNTDLPSRTRTHTCITPPFFCIPSYTLNRSQSVTNLTAHS